MGEEGTKFYRCQCFYSSNYYVAEYDVHLEYLAGSDEEFFKTSQEVLKPERCINEDKTMQILEQIKAEYKRRKTLDQESMKRKSEIKSLYVPLHGAVYRLKDAYLRGEFLAAVNYAKTANATFPFLSNMLQKEKAAAVYRLPVFTKEFCETFLEEIEHFERSEMPKGRPNTMNNSGILLGELGFDDNFLTPLRENYLNPLAKILYPEWVEKDLDSHKAFTVKYKEGEDLDLGFHFDNAEVTLNVSLGKEYEDGSLYFGSMREEISRLDRATEVQHVVGDGVLHRGQHKHGAMPISSGERVNLIMWMRSSSVRNKLCPMCDKEPTLSPASGFGDGFTMQTSREVEMCSLH